MAKFGITRIQEPLTDRQLITLPWFRFLSNLFVTTQSGQGILQGACVSIGNASESEAVANGDYFLIPSVARAITIVSACAYTTVGTATVNIKIGSTSVTGLSALAATTTSTTATAATGARSAAVGSAVKFTVSAVAGIIATNSLLVQVNYTCP